MMKYDIGPVQHCLIVKQNYEGQAPASLNSRDHNNEAGHFVGIDTWVQVRNYDDPLMKH